MLLPPLGGLPVRAGSLPAGAMPLAAGLALLLSLPPTHERQQRGTVRQGVLHCTQVVAAEHDAARAMTRRELCAHSFPMQRIKKAEEGDMLA